jgi:hypothetical protein
MGTNYYLRAKPACDHCGRGPDKGLHIGKSSGGWCFALHVYPDGEHDGEPAPRDLVEWVLRFHEGIIDEYGDDISPEEMIGTITKRGAWTAAGHVLRRHDIDRDHCIGHGDGSYDLMIGWFS